MLTDLESPAPPPRLWSRRKIAGWFLGVGGGLIVVILSYDETLEPYEDLKPTFTRIPDASTNGFLFLENQWASLPRETKMEWHAVGMEQGWVAWNPALVDQLRKGREHALDDLRKALAKPVWLAPIKLDDVPRAENGYPSWSRHLRFLVLEAGGAIRSGDLVAALALIQDLNTLSLRQIAGSSDPGLLAIGTRLQSQVISLCCDCLAYAQPNAGELAALEKLLQTEPAIKEAWPGIVKNHSARMENLIARIKAGNLKELGMPLLAGLLLKKNKTLNALHRQAGQVMEIAFQPFPDKPTAQVATGAGLLPRRAPLFQALDPNATGTHLLLGWYPVNSIFSAYKAFFQSRAMRVRLALYRWRLVNPASWPSKLEELVPEFLPAVPLDPWNGKPLLWDAGTEVIYAVGQDWKADLPTFSTTDRFWINDNSYSPCLRLTLPPWTPKPPAAAGKKPMRAPKSPPKPTGVAK